MATTAKIRDYTTTIYIHCRGYVDALHRGATKLTNSSVYIISTNHASQENVAPRWTSTDYDEVEH